MDNEKHQRLCGKVLNQYLSNKQFEMILILRLALFGEV